MNPKIKYEIVIEILVNINSHGKDIQIKWFGIIISAFLFMLNDLETTTFNWFKNSVFPVTKIFKHLQDNIL